VAGLLVSVALVSAPTLASAQATTITFDELLPRSVHGLVFSGVRFEFLLAGVPSTDATFGGSGPGCLQQFICDPSLEGNAAGQLVVTFLDPVSTFGFGLARTTFEPLSPGATVAIFDAASNPLAFLPIDLVSTIGFSEAAFTFSDASIGRFALTFPDPAAAERFALDNLSFVTAVPEPWALTQVALGCVLLWTGIRRRRAQDPFTGQT
jgi:hypothetical protein